MSPASYRTAPPRGDVLTLWGPGGLRKSATGGGGRGGAGRGGGGGLGGGVLGGGQALEGCLERGLGLAVGGPVVLLEGVLALFEGGLRVLDGLLDVLGHRARESGRARGSR